MKPARSRGRVLAPAPSSRSSRAASPTSAAAISGVEPSALARSGPAPRSSSSAPIPSSLRAAACRSGVIPFGSIASGSTPTAHELAHAREVADVDRAEQLDLVPAHLERLAARRRCGRLRHHAAAAPDLARLRLELARGLVALAVARVEERRPPLGVARERIGIGLEQELDQQRVAAARRVVQRGRTARVASARIRTAIE